ncbi:Dynein heavy chain and region D6 of dynein motor [Carpediemonas membranifera]|uniref:Dynein heavy chain and region D6 of dynein motor n=1 Tax=Carpediemonas membranifera TaxID=201153 RepID=A0A8J6E0F4_9EUKA|nr:Dynein heavy chain and region D6 of dynein motor [Carpediemonas membranifera]|eukprot:KAG9392138.1 Dynein heavy chain and region D6 of dynein motor [Carpediemonas membranifera]
MKDTEKLFKFSSKDISQYDLPSEKPRYKKGKITPVDAGDVGNSHVASALNDFKRASFAGPVDEPSCIRLENPSIAKSSLRKIEDEIYAEDTQANPRPLVDGWRPQHPITQDIDRARQIVTELRTGEDAIRYFSQAGDRDPVKFVYLVPAETGKDFRPYDLLVVPKSKTGTDYYTISASGVVHVCDGQPSDVVLLGDWLRESSLFNVLRCMPFFQEYFKRKAFKLWVKHVRYRRFCNNRQRLTQTLFPAKPHFLEPIQKVYALCYKLSVTKGVDITVKQTFEREELQQVQAQTRKELGETLEATVEGILAILTATIDGVVARTRSAADEDDTGLPSFIQPQKVRSMVQAKAELIEKQRAVREAEHERRKLGDLVRLFDTFVLEALIAVNLHAATSVIASVSDTAVKRRAGLLLTMVEFDSVACSFTPSKAQYRDTLESIFTELRKTVTVAPRVISAPVVRQHVHRGRETTHVGVDDFILGSPEGAVLPYEPFIEAEAKIFSTLEENFQQAVAYAQVFDEYRDVHNFGQTWAPEAYSNQDASVETLRADIAKLQRWIVELERMKTSQAVDLIHVDSRKLKQRLTPIPVDALEHVKQVCLQKFRDLGNSVVDGFRGHTKVLAQQPRHLKEFTEFVELVNHLESISEGLMEDVRTCIELDKVMAEADPKLEQASDKALLGAVGDYKESFLAAKEEAAVFIKQQMGSMVSQLDSHIVTLEEETAKMADELQEGIFVDANADPTQVLSRLQAIGEAIATLEGGASTYGSYQKLFNVSEAAFEKLQETRQLHADKTNLWTTVDHWNEVHQQWLYSSWLTLDSEAIVAELAAIHSKSVRFKNNLEEEGEDGVASTLVRRIKQFQQHSDLVSTLGNPALRNRHWMKIFALLEGGDQLVPGSPFTLDQLMQMGIDRVKTEVSDISGTASGEYSLELALDKIEAGWEHMEFTVKDHVKGKGTANQADVFILSSIEEIQQLLEDNMVTLQTMLASRFIVGIREPVEKWEQRLILLSDVLDEWVTCQRSWLYLEVIFSQADIQRQLPVESQKFARVDTMWNQHMASVHARPGVIAVLGIEGLKDKFVQANQALDEIQKSLEDYLQTKRIAFPRFYFLSNDELLEILSQTTDPQAVQPHLRKCFEAMAHLDFAEPGSDQINAMQSVEGERVMFIEPLFARGVVESWLKEIEGGMVATVRDHVARCLKAAMDRQQTRAEWLQSWPAQCLLTVDQLMWTSGAEKALNAVESGTDKEALVLFHEACIAQLDQMVTMVRGQLTSLQRKAIGALVVIDVHARDVLERMNQAGCSSIHDFDWVAQLRYYWEEDDPERPCKTRQTNTQLDYAYEYLGASGRLVVTPLTDRCYITLTSALHLHLGGSPQGPAGTGKTETTKDLAKALAVQCVVFNCSEGLDYKMMGRFFSGLAQCGAWACFDEFNRIDIEVLSVIAQQILTIQQAIMASAKRFVFEGQEIPLNASCGFFITMNPGYAGRTELPDNLKALFRPISMMVPDYGLIAEIILFSEGFSTARALSRKMAQLYKLSSEQLSQCDHYDFGMRAVKSVLVMAGGLKRQYEDLGEDIVLIRALRDSNVPKFLAQDVPLFMGIIQDLFPGVEIPSVDYGSLQEAIEADLTSHNLQPVPAFVTKCIQFYETHIVRHGLMLVGQSGTGKSTICTSMARSLQALFKAGDTTSPHFKPVQRYILNPKSVSMGELYGMFDEVSHEWTDGLVANIARQVVNARDDTKRWIVFDGPVDALWIENMNTVLDDNKMLCLANGERIRLPDTVNLVFEVQDLAVASPATVSRCGMVYLESVHLGWRPLAKSWTEQFKPAAARLISVALGFDIDHEREKADQERANKLAKEEDEERRQADLAREKARAAKGQKDGEASDTDDDEDSGSTVDSLSDNDEDVPETTNSRRRKSISTVGTDQRFLALEANCTALAEDVCEIIVDKYMDKVGDGILKFIRANCREDIASVDGQLVQSFLDIVLHFIADLADRKAASLREKLDREHAEAVEMALDAGAEPPKRPDIRDTPWATICPDDAVPESIIADIDRAVSFALVWGFGGSMAEEARSGFEDFIREQFTAIGLSNTMPDDRSVYDWSIGDGAWLSWDSLTPAYEFSPATPFFDIVVPTADTVRANYIVNLLIRGDVNVLLCGPTGTGKTLSVNAFMRDRSTLESFVTDAFSFSAQTTAKQTQQFIEAKLEKKRKNLLAPPSGMRQIFFIDDINMPAKEEYGAQPPVELLRQTIVQRGFYDRAKLFFKNVDHTLFVSACAPPGGGRSVVTQRLTRHFFLLATPEMSASSMRRIFSGILGGFLANPSVDPAVAFNPDVVALSDSIVKASVDLYHQISEDLRPTPAKSHYTFNLRDLAKTIQGLLLAVPAAVNTRFGFLRLWAHEVSRTFRDRLICDEDTTWFDRQVVKTITDHFDINEWDEAKELDTSQALESIKDEDAELDDASAKERAMVTVGLTKAVPDIMFGAWCPDKAEQKRYGSLDDDSRADFRFQYKELHDINGEVDKRLNEALEEFNLSSDKEMELVFFKDAIAHLSRVARVIRQPRGNALLVGVGGSGRQSLVRLAASMAEYFLIQPEISKNYGRNEFVEDIKKAMMKAGVETTNCVFLLTDSQIVSESFLEDINNVLNSGEIPNIWAPDEMETIITAVRPICAKLGKEGTKDNIYSTFVNLVRQNMHVVLCMSPVGDALRRRLRQFPSLLSNCTLDWYHPWPSTALFSVAGWLLRNLDVEEKDREAGIIDKLAQLCMTVHTSVQRQSQEFYEQFRRHVYVTPTSYLELIRQYSMLLGEKRKQIIGKIETFEGGLEKLKATRVQVAEMQEDLVKLQPVLEQASKDTAELLVQLEVDQKEAASVRENVEQEEKQVSVMAREAQEIKDDAQSDLDAALPALHAAIKALKSLNKNDITEIKSFKTPPELVKVVMESICIMKDVKPTWEESKKLLSDMNFLGSLAAYDKDNIPERIIKKIRKYAANPDFHPDKVEKVSKAAKSLCMWVLAMLVYSDVAKTVAPKRQRLKEAEDELSVQQAALAKKQAELKTVEDRLAELQAKYDASIAKKNELELKTADTKVRLTRAEKLVGGLAAEAERWAEQKAKLESNLTMLVGNILLASGYLAYLGPFNVTFREKLIDEWCQKCAELNVPAFKNGSDFTLDAVLGDPVEIREWGQQGLPSDPLSVSNAIITTKARRWPLCIDPQGQANRWIRKREAENNLQVTKMSEGNFLRTLENAIRIGTPVLLENVEEVLDPALEPILLKQVFKRGGRNLIRIGDTEVDYSPDFRLYITTKLPSPHFSPETSVKVTIINFTVTQSGLEEQLLATVARSERPDLEQQRDQIIVQLADGKRQLQAIQDRILQLLNQATGNILDDEELINTLDQSKETTNDINARLEEAEKTSEEINITREQYRPVSTRASLLFFVLADLGQIDPMYQYSLPFFTGLFNQCLAKAEKSDVVSTRIQTLISYVTMQVYASVCRGLFESHKQLFAFLCAAAVERTAGTVSPALWSLFFRPLVDAEGVDEEIPVHLSKSQYTNLKRVQDVVGDRVDIMTPVCSDEDGFWTHYLQCDSPQSEKLPGQLEELTPFEKLVLLRVLRTEKVVFGIPIYIGFVLGEKFTSAPQFDLRDAYADTTSRTPIIFILSAGANPLPYLHKLAEEKGMSSKLRSISLGQGQGPIADKMIQQGRRNGDWVCLQNCHLSISWMPDLERAFQSIDEEESHPSFRLWLTSMPSPRFPVPVLQGGVKITNEPPKGLKANLAQSFHHFDEADFELTGENVSQARRVEWKRMLFTLAFFHGVLQERRRYGPIAWNIRYDWNESDFDVSVRTLRMFLVEYKAIPYDALNYLIGYIHYGGRVTDYLDQRNVQAFLTDYFKPEIHAGDYTFTADGVYKPMVGSIEEIREYLNTLPVNEPPAVFGLHENGDITHQQQETSLILETIISVQPRDSSGSSGETPEDQVLRMAIDIRQKVPDDLNLENAHDNSLPKDKNGNYTPLAVVLVQEVERFNGLLAIIRTTLKDLDRAIRGLVVMSPDLETMFDAFLLNRVPNLWSAAAYPSLKPLASWVRDLDKRIAFMAEWISHGPPNSFWLSGFFFTQGFLTGALQTHARETLMPIDDLVFETEVVGEKGMEFQPDTGVHVHGLFIEGARWDDERHKLVEQTRGVLLDTMAPIWLKPVSSAEYNPESTYRCPVYKTTERAGVLSTTGHSTNFVMSLDLPIDCAPEWWIRRGVALLSQEPY